jgi:hypothetical protein
MPQHSNGPTGAELVQAAADSSLGGERLHHSTPRRRGNRPLVTRERLAELFAILEAMSALRRELSLRRDNRGWEARP